MRLEVCVELLTGLSHALVNVLVDSSQSRWRGGGGRGARCGVFLLSSRHPALVDRRRHGRPVVPATTPNLPWPFQPLSREVRYYGRFPVPVHVALDPPPSKEWVKGAQVGVCCVRGHRTRRSGSHRNVRGGLGETVTATSSVSGTSDSVSRNS